MNDNVIDMGILTSVADRHDHQLLDAELNALPERYRQALVLRYLAGKTSSEVAADLGLTIGTIDGLLKRGKDELRQRLMKRGITIGAALAAIQLTQESTCAIGSDALIDSTIQAGLAWDQASDKFLPDMLSNGQISIRALELAGKDVMIMTTGAKSILTIGLTLGGLFAVAGGMQYLEDSPQGTAEAAGLISTLSVANSVENPISLATLTGAPTATAPSDTAARDQQPESGDQLIATDSGDAAAADKDPQNRAGKLLDKAASDRPLRRSGRSKWQDLTNRGPRIEAIMNSLSSQASANFVDITLKEAMDVIQTDHEIEIKFDLMNLNDNGIATDLPVNLVSEGVSLKSILRMMLDPLELDYIVENEVLMITTRTHAEETFDTRIYRLDGIREHFDDGEFDQLPTIIRLTIQPHAWKVLGRPAAGGGMGGGGLGIVENDGANQNKQLGPEPMGGMSAKGTIMAFGNMLIIRQTQRSHEEISDFLDQLAAQFSKEDAESPKQGGGYF